MTHRRRITATAATSGLLTAVAVAANAATAFAQHGGGHGGGGHSGGGVRSGTILVIAGVGGGVIVAILVWILVDARRNAPSSGRPRDSAEQRPRRSGGAVKTGRPAKGGPTRARSRAARAARRRNR